MDAREELAALEAEMAADAALPLREANLVFGEGNVRGEVMFIGEAPGANEDRLKRPFVGRAGQLLDGMIRSIGWRREDTYITNIVKRRPPENRDPSPEEIAAYRPYLARQIAILNPKIIVTLGRFAMNYFLPEAKIMRDHGRVMSIDSRLIVPVYHPAAALRSTEMLNVLRGDFSKLPGILSGDLVPDAAPTVAVEPRKAKKGQPKQAGLF